MGFIKAPPGAVTRYLWVGGVHGMSVPHLAELFAPYGNPLVLLPEAEVHRTASQQPQLQATVGTGNSPTAKPHLMTAFHAFLAFENEGDAAAAVAAVTRNAPWPAADGRKLVLHYADVRQDKRPVPRPVCTSTVELGVPGLVLLKDFVTADEEQALLAAVVMGPTAAAEGAAPPPAGPAVAPAGLGGGGASAELGGEESGAAAPPVLAAPVSITTATQAGGLAPCCGGSSGHWEVMAKRRVQHYGYRFDYATRNVDLSKPLGPLPPWAAALAERIAALPEVSQALDQLTVNEYDPGVGLAPHVDTHSAFTGPIISLSLGSSVVMEMRKGDIAKPLLLPARSLLVMGGESRYAWQHYIPHRIADIVGSQRIARTRRVSLTFRKARGYACDCCYPDSCDSQQANLPPTRISQLAQQSLPSRNLNNQQQKPQHQQHLLDEEQQAMPGELFGLAGSARGASAASPASRPPPPAPPPPPTTTTTTLSSPLPPSEARIKEQGGIRWREGVKSCMATGRLTDGCRHNHPSGHAHEKEKKGAASHTDPEDNDEEGRLAALEAEYVHKVYDAIAPHFSATRFAIWPKVRAFIESLPRGGVVADVGCGNGKYFGVRRDLAVLGSDISAGLAEVAAQRLYPAGLPPSAAPPAADALVADALCLPFRAASCDGVLCIAVLHHLSSRRRRVRLLRQLLRALRPGKATGGGGGGRALVTVWATEQEDPAKTTAKWTRIPAPNEGSGSESKAMEMTEAAPAVAAGNSRRRLCICETPEATVTAGPAGVPREDSIGNGARNSSRQGSGGEGVDYFVPWHLPFHRTEAARAARVAKEAARGGAGSAVGHDAAAVAAGAPKIDAAKGAVVFQRYYHLFEREELVGLVEEALEEGAAEVDVRVAGSACDVDAGGDGSDADEVGEGGVHGTVVKRSRCGVIEDVFYDRSNWCIVFRRDR